MIPKCYFEFYFVLKSKFPFALTDRLAKSLLSLPFRLHEILGHLALEAVAHLVEHLHRELAPALQRQLPRQHDPRVLHELQERLAALPQIEPEDLLQVQVEAARHVEVEALELLLEVEAADDQMSLISTLAAYNSCVSCYSHRFIPINRQTSPF